MNVCSMELWQAIFEASPTSTKSNKATFHTESINLLTAEHMYTCVLKYILLARAHVYMCFQFQHYVRHKNAYCEGYVQYF